MNIGRIRIQARPRFENFFHAAALLVAAAVGQATRTLDGEVTVWINDHPAQLSLVALAWIAAFYLVVTAFINGRLPTTVKADIYLEAGDTIWIDTCETLSREGAVYRVVELQEAYRMNDDWHQAAERERTEALLAKADRIGR